MGQLCLEPTLGQKKKEEKTVKEVESDNGMGYLKTITLCQLSLYNNSKSNMLAKKCVCECYVLVFFLT